MTEAEIIKHLSQVRDLKETYEKNLRIIAELKSKATKTNHPMSGEKVQGSPDPDPMGNAVTAWVTIQDENDRILLDMEQATREVTTMICHVPIGIQRKILMERYIICYSFHDIAKINKHDVSWIMKLHRRAIKYLSATERPVTGL